MKKYTNVLFPKNNGIERLAKSPSHEELCINRLDGEVDEYGEPLGEQEQTYDFTFDGVLNSGILTTKQRKVLYMRLVEERTFDSIGKELGTSRQNIFEMYHKAIKRLQDNQTWRNYAD